MSFIQILTYVSYLFIVLAYAIKVVKILKMPLNLRWELYPVPHEEGYSYGGSYYEKLEFWKKPQKKKFAFSIVYMLKKYFLFNGYFWKNRKYWFSLYPWHLGFYLIVLFHILSFICALLIITAGVQIGADSVNGVGVGMYYLTITVGACSFIIGALSSIGMLYMKLSDKALNDYAVPYNYFNYVFIFIVFMSGFVHWFFFDPSLIDYRQYWVSLLTWEGVNIHSSAYTHILLFSLFLIYLPFTRSTHYITILISFFSILWNDNSSKSGSKDESRIKQSLSKPVSWSAPHIQTGKPWSEVVTNLPDTVTGKGPSK